MKKTYLKSLKVFLTLLLLCGVCNAWGDTSTLTLNSTTKFGTTSGSTLGIWTCTGSGIQNSYQSTYEGQQFGTGSTNYVYTFSASFANKTVTSVMIKAAAGSTTPTYDISVGGKSWKSGNLSKTPTEYTGTGEGTGNVVITLDQNKGSKAVYLGKIVVTYTEEGAKYTVTYDANGASSGAVPTDDNEYEKNAPVTVLGNTGNLTKVGYNFGGWNTNADATGTDYAAGSTFAIQQSTTLYAKWNAISYNITIADDVEGGSCSVKIGEEEATTATIGTKLTLSNTPNDGYKFVKYLIDYTNQKGESKQLEVTTDSYNMPASDIVVTPIFRTLNNYTITLNNRGLTSKVENVIEDSKYTEVLECYNPTDEFDGYTFCGWSTVQEASGNNLIKEDAIVTGKSTNITLYAVYSKTEGDAATWDEVLFSEIKSTDEIVIAGKLSDGEQYYAITNDKGTSEAPVAEKITISGTQISNPSANIIWNISGNATDGYIIYPNGVTDKWLYCNTTASSSNNNNIRVGTGERKVWEYKSSYNEFATKDEYTQRYLCIYSTNPDWRGYTSYSNAGIMKFFKKNGGATTTYTLGVIKYSRDVTSGNYGTICLPNDATVAGATLYSVLGVDNQDEPNILYLEEVETAQAGVPYIFKATSTQLVASYEGNAVEAPVGEDAANGLVGSFEKAQIEAGLFNYILKSNQWMYVPEDNTNYVGANKAYLNIYYTPTVTKSKSEIDMMFESEPTGIETIKNVTFEDGFNASGMKVGNNFKGIVILKGKKYLNK